MRSDFYVYALCYPNGTPFYIGKGHGNRVNWHLHYRSTNNHTINTIKKIRKEGGEPIVEIKRSSLIEEIAFSYERRFILKYGRRDKKTGCLCNLTDGGEGTSNISEAHRQRIIKSNRNRVVTQATKDKISNALLGRTLTIEHRENIGKEVRGEKHPLYGKKHTELAKRRMSRAKKLTRELREKNNETGRD